MGRPALRSASGEIKKGYHVKFYPSDVLIARGLAPDKSLGDFLADLIKKELLSRSGHKTIHLSPKSKQWSDRGHEDSTDRCAGGELQKSSSKAKARKSGVNP